MKGKIVVCVGPSGDSSEIKKLGGKGLVLITDVYGSIAENFGDFPVTVIYPKYGVSILNYITSTR